MNKKKILKLIIVNIMLSINIMAQDSPGAPVIGAEIFSIDENVADVVGTVVASGNNLEYSVASDEMNFDIDEDSGELTLLSPQDFEMPPNSLTVDVTVTDEAGLSSTATITVNIDDVNEAPLIVNQIFSVDENVADVVGTVVASDVDVDDGDSLVYSVASDETNFDIDSSTGELTLLSPQDFETTPSLTVDVTVTDRAGLHTTATITVNIGDVNDAGVLSLTGVVEEGGTISATLTDADGLAGVAVSFELLDGSDNVLETKPITGSDTTADVSFDLASDQSLVGKQLRIRASYTDELGTVYAAVPTQGQFSSPISAFPAAVSNVNDAGVLSSPTGNLEEGGTISATLTDADGLAGVVVNFELLDENGKIVDTKPITGSGTTAAVSFDLAGDQSLVGKQLRIRASYRDTYGTIYAVAPTPGQLSSPISAVSVAVSNVEDAGFLSSISGAIEEGGTISTTLTDADGLAGVAVKFELLDGSDNVLETKPIIGSGIRAAVSFDLAGDQSLVGKQLRIRASYMDTHGTIYAVTPTQGQLPAHIIGVSAVVSNVNDAGVLSLTGVVEEGGTISTTLTDDDGIDEVAVKFELLDESGDVVETKTIPGSDTTADVSFTLSNDHSLVGQVLTIRASYMDELGAVYAISPAVGQLPSRTVDSAAVRVSILGVLLDITGDVEEGGIISTTLTDVNGITGVAVKFELLDESDAVVETKTIRGSDTTADVSFTLSDDQSLVGQRLRIRASYTDELGTIYAILPEDRELPAPISASSVAVSNVNDVGLLSEITGDFEEGGEISITLTDVDGLYDRDVKFELLDESGDVVDTKTIEAYVTTAAISFTLASSQSLVGQTLRIRASYTDALGQVYAIAPTPGQLPAPISAFSAAVSNGNIGVLSLTGTVEEGGEISITLTDVDGLEEVAVTFELLDESGAVIETKIIPSSDTTANVSFALADDESLVGQELTIRASYTDALGTVYAVIPTAGQLPSRTISAVVANVNDAPTAVILSRTSLTLVNTINTPSLIVLADISIIDSDASTNRISIDNADFTVSQVNGKITVSLDSSVDISTDDKVERKFTISVSDSSITDSIAVTAEFTLIVINNPVGSLLTTSESIISKTQVATLRALDDIIDVPTASFSAEDQDVIDKLNIASRGTDDAKKQEVIAELAPETHTTIGVGIESVVGSISSSLGNRNTPSGLSNLNGPEAPESSNNIRKGAFWYDFNYNTGDRDSNGNVPGYDYSGYTIQLGYERLYGETFLGASFSYGDTNIDNSNNAGDADITTLSLGAYGNYQKDDTFFTGTFILAFSDVESTRNRQVLGNLSGETNALSYDLELIYGKIYKKSNLTLTSLTGLRYSNSSIDDIDEKGGFGTSTSSQSYDSLYLKFGGIANWIIKKDSVAKTEQSLSLIINYDINLLDLERNVSSQFTSGGDKFETAGVDQSRGSLTFGTNYQYVNKAVIYELGYNYRFSSISSSNNLSVKIKHNF